MGKKMSLSFKDTKKDRDLWEVIKNLDDKSHDIKKILYDYFLEKGDIIVEEKVKKSINQEKEKLPDIDFGRLDEIDIDMASIKASEIEG